MPGKRGFASMDPKWQREIARKGGLEAQRRKTAHLFAKGSDEAREAGRKGAAAREKNRKIAYLERQKTP
jgi:general stress protein YciG